MLKMNPKKSVRRILSTKPGPSTILPVPGATPLATQQMSRQQRYKLRRIAEGLCLVCGGVRHDGSRSLCGVCLTKTRERMRAHTGAVRRNVRAASYHPPAETLLPARKKVAK